MRRSARCLIAIMAILLFVAVALQLYLERGWVVSAEAFSDRADRSLQRGVALLSDRSLPPAERFSGYQEALSSATSDLISSLDRQPTQAQLVARLATVELEQNAASPEAREIARRRVELASRLAPQVPRVQAQLGELLLRMGYRNEALRYLGTAARLDSSYCSQVVTLGTAFGVELELLREILPNRSEALSALGSAVQPDQVSTYLGWIESALQGGVTPLPELFSVYLSAAIKGEEVERAVNQLQALTLPRAIDGGAAEGARLHAIASGQFSMGDLTGATSNVDAALEADGSQARYAATAGDIAFAAGSHELAVERFQLALKRIATQPRSERARSHYYRRLGEAFEALGRFDDAFDSYQRALEWWPEEPYSKRRLERLAPGSTSGLEGSRN